VKFLFNAYLWDSRFDWNIEENLKWKKLSNEMMGLGVQKLNVKWRKP